MRMQQLNKKPKPPLHRAARLVYDAIEIAYQYKRDETYLPTSEDLSLFSALNHALWECHCTARDITHCMHERLGEKEEAAI